MSKGITTGTPRSPSPISYGSLFHHKSWPEPWSSPNFPPTESLTQRRRRFRNKGWWDWNFEDPSDVNQKFLYLYAFDERAWPWGYFIYRTTYASDEDWAAALAKLDRYFDVYSPPGQRRARPEDYNASATVREGYRNVIIEDRGTLDNVDVSVVFQRHKEWLERHWIDSHASPRFGHCLMIDEPCLRSILAAREPKPRGNLQPQGPLGYINILDIVGQGPTAVPKYDEGPFYNRCMRLELDALYTFAFECEQRPLYRQYLYLDGPDWVLYTDGRHAEKMPKDVLTHRWVGSSKRGEYVRQPCEMVNGDKCTPVDEGQSWGSWLWSSMFPWSG
ncbi:hypothetical protein BDW62DRAFT_174592 [Aspergillus aurantiobrunneus]